MNVKNQNKESIMSTFSTSKSYKASSTFVPYAIECISDSFTSEGFEVSKKSISFNKSVIEVTKGNLVKKAIGLKQGLEISFESNGDSVLVEARGTVLKDQLIASSITLFVTWPVLIPQIIGLIKQSALDDKAIGVVDTAYANYTNQNPSYCTHCGGRISGPQPICPHCGTSLR